MFEHFVRTLTANGTDSDGDDGGTTVVEGDCVVSFLFLSPPTETHRLMDGD
jgi:hypothetical protein